MCIVTLHRLMIQLSAISCTSTETSSVGVKVYNLFILYSVAFIKQHLFMMNRMLTNQKNKGMVKERVSSFSKVARH